jgi:4-hydroxy-tetrahydrodipicolinate reductase
MKYGIFGSSGKMSKCLLECSKNFKQVQCVKVINRDFKLEEVQDLDCIIDFSTPLSSINLLKNLFGLKNIFVVCGTTGFTKEEFLEYNNLTSGTKVLYSANFSLGVFKVSKALKDLTIAFKEYDVEILEKHHNLKKDAPSGTALKFGKIVADAKNIDFDQVKTFDRNHKREKDEIGFCSIRQGSIFGFHEVSFASNDERIWIGHEAFNKNIFANGAIESAIKANKVLKHEQYGLFTLEDLESNVF